MIEIEHLTKRYGSHTAVSDLNLTIEAGQIYGFLGPNGAGKSTTMNIMTGCLASTEGTVRIDGYDIYEEPAQAKARIGYLPEQPPLYLDMTPLEYLAFVAKAKGVKGQDRQRQLERAMEVTQIDGVKDRLIKNLSKGYKQRVGIAQALLGSPKVIILDEPTVGLDPIQIIEIRDLIKQLGRDHTVIFSSHILSEVQAICDKILIIAHGKLVAFDTPDRLEQSLLSGSEIGFTTDAGTKAAEAILAKVDHLTDVQTQARPDGLTEVRLKTDSKDIYAVSRQLFFAFAEEDQPLLELNLKKASLEDIFLELTENSDAQAQDGADAPEEKEDEAQ